MACWCGVGGGVGGGGGGGGGGAELELGGAKKNDLRCWFVKINHNNGKKNGNKMCEERLTLSIYTPGKIKQVSKEKKDHTQVKNDSSELFTVLIIYDSNICNNTGV
jgi:hypothetical protein